MQNRVLSGLMVSVIVLLVWSLPGSGLAEEAPAKLTFDEHILPVFRNKCGACHNSNDKKGDLVLDNYGAAMRGGASGEVIRADGDAENSSLYRVTAHLSEPFMPPSGEKVPDADLALIRRWIEQGALENNGSVAKVKKPVLVAKATISAERPPGPAPMPAGLSIEPLLTSSRGNAVTALAVNPWSSLAAVSGHKQILLYNTQTLELAGVLPFEEGTAHVLKFSRNGALLLAGGGRGSHSGRVIVFDVQSGRRVTEVGDEYDVVLAADISPDQTQIALGGPKKIVRVYEIATGNLMYEKNKHTDWILSLEYSPDGVLLATADRSNGMFVWEAYTGREFYVLQGHTGPITDVSWSLDSNLLASASEDTTIRLWEMENGSQVRSWGAHGAGTQAVRFTRDGRIVSTGRDLTAKLWDVNGAQQRAFGGLPDVGMEVAFDAELGLVLAGDLAGQVHVWNGADGAVVGQLKTNPPPVAARLELALTELAPLQLAATQAQQAVAAIEQGIADRLMASVAAAEKVAAAQVVVDQTAAAVELTKVKLATLTTATAAAQAAYTLAEPLQTAAVAAREAQVAAIEAATTEVVRLTELFQQSEATLADATTASQQNPADEALLSAVTNAQTAAQAAAEQLAAANSKQQELTTQLAPLAGAATTAINAATSALATQTAAVAEQAAAEAELTSTMAMLSASTEALNTAKTAAEQAAVAAVVTQELQQQLAAAQQAAQAAAASASRVQGKVDRLQAALKLPEQTASAQ